MNSSSEPEEVNNQTWVRFTMSTGETFNISLPRSQTPFSSKKFVVGDEYWETSVWFTDRSGFIRYEATAGQSIYYIIDGNGNASTQLCGLELERNGIKRVCSGYLSVDD